MTSGVGYPLVEAAQALAPQIRALSADIEACRRVPPSLLAALADAGVFRMLVPAALGGSECEPLVALRTLEELSAADGSVGWIAAIGAGSNLFSAYLETAVAERIFDTPQVITGGVFNPVGRAAPVPGGYRVSGRWSYMSGCQHCAWLMGNCRVEQAEGEAELRLLAFPADAALIHDTWRVSGLRGTGSHDVEVQDIFVPEGYGFRLFLDPPRHSGKLYAFPLDGFLGLLLAVVATGIARGSIITLTELARLKTPVGAKNLLSEKPLAQIQLAQATGLLEAARALLFGSAAEAWEAVTAGREVSGELHARVQLAAVHAVSVSAQAVDLMYGLGGGGALYDSSPLQRQFRDIHAVTQHVQLNQGRLEALGKKLFSLPEASS